MSHHQHESRPSQQAMEHQKALSLRITIIIEWLDAATLPKHHLIFVGFSRWLFFTVLELPCFWCAENKKTFLSNLCKTKNACSLSHNKHNNNHVRHNEGTCPIISMNRYLLCKLWKTQKALSLRIPIIIEWLDATTIPTHHLNYVFVSRWSCFTILELPRVSCSENTPGIVRLWSAKVWLRLCKINKTCLSSRCKTNKAFSLSRNMHNNNHVRHNGGTCPIISMNLYLPSRLWKT